MIDFLTEGFTFGKGATFSKSVFTCSHIQLFDYIFSCGFKCSINQLLFLLCALI